MRPTIKMLQAKIVKIDSEHGKQVRELNNRLEHWRNKAGEQATLVAEMESRLNEVCTQLGSERYEHRKTKQVVATCFKLTKTKVWDLDGSDLKRFVTFVFEALQIAAKEETK